MPIMSPHPDVEIPDVSLYEFLFTSLEDSELDRIALIDGMTGAETTYRDLLAQINGIAGALAARGIAPGDVVAIHAPNIPAFVPVFHGILRAGAVATPVNALYKADEIADQLRDSGAKLIFTISPLLEQARSGAIAAGLSNDQVVVLDGAEGHSSLRDLLAERKSAPEVHINSATHVAVLPYSSGTTGKPKGVMLSHRNLLANVAQAAPIVGVTRDDRVVAILPFTHIYGLTVLLNISLAKRATLITMPRFDLAEFLRIVQDLRATYVFIAPPMAVALAKHPLIDEYDLSSLHTLLSGAAPLDGILGAAVSRRLSVRMRQGYGMSEMSPISHAIPFDREDIPLGTIGLALPNIAFKLIEPATGNEIPMPAEGTSEAGELLVRGPNIMLGYLGNTSATRETLDADGFLHTGDLATVSAEGYVTIVDRLKELIKYKGHQVAPAELEALLLTHPMIVDAAVIGVHDEEGQEVPKAFIVPRPGADLSAEAVMEFVAEHVAPYKKVRQVAFIDAVPKSSAGKILRKDLRAQEVNA